MLLNKKEILAAVKVASDYASCSKNLDDSWMMDFQNSIKQKGYEFAIKILNVPEKQHAVKGFFVAKDNSYEIVLLQGLNHCWRRLVLCKELFHMLLDNAEYRDMNLDEHIIGTLGVVISEKTPSNAVKSEIIAEVAAMEFLFSYQARLEELKSNLTTKEIAEKYKCPLQLVEKYLLEENMNEIGKCLRS